MLSRTLTWLLLAALPASAAAAGDPADPHAVIPPTRYTPVLSGTQSFRPVEPLPWGDVNRRVMPKPDKPESQGKAKPNAPQDERKP